jgi:hypothetical protein
MLNVLRAALDSAIGKRLAMGAACFARACFDFDRFLAITNPLGVRLQKCGLTQRFPVEVDLRSSSTIARRVSEMLKTGSEQRMTIFDGLYSQNASQAATLS